MTQPVTLESQTPGLQQKAVFSAPDLSDEPIKVELQWAMRPNGDLTLGWRFNVQALDNNHWWDLTVSAQSSEDLGKVINLVDWTWNLASYEVFARPVQDPFFGNRSIVVDPHDAIAASPFGWHDANGVDGPEFLDTRGNNISAQEDLDGDDTGGTRPVSATLDFTAPLVLPALPATYRLASIINAFYWSNLTHDATFNHGFDEISGNFQHLNYSGDGIGNDRVEVDVHDGAGASMPRCRRRPRANRAAWELGLFPVPLPGKDTALDATIITHEYGHGVSTRLTGGPANSNSLNAVQSNAMGEGWSDWLFMVMTASPTDTPDTPRTSGDWVLNAPGIGVRRQPYSFDLTVDTLTFADYNGDVLPARTLPNRTMPAKFGPRRCGT